MQWKDLSAKTKRYLIAIYLSAIPFSLLSFASSNNYSLPWMLLTVTSLFVATVNVRLPKISLVISMGDVFTILALVHFGPGPALVTYWLDIVVAHFTDMARRHGLKFFSKLVLYRFGFNLACCALSVGMMDIAYDLGTSLIDVPAGITVSQNPATMVVGLVAIAITWFLVNTVTVSLAVALMGNSSFWSTWCEGLALYLLNFSGSAAAAGIISILYQRAGYLNFLLSVPIAVVLYQLYQFYIDKYDQAQSHIRQLDSLYWQTIETMATAVDAKDPYTAGHIRRVQAYAIQLARCIGINDEGQLMAIKAGALLHDIGKIAIPEYILNKPTVLTQTEFEKMKLHPVVGAHMLRGISFPYPVVPLVKSHHERWDGNGYPEGLKGEEIPIGARILSIVDCYDALTTNRPYRSPMQRPQIIEFFGRESGKSYDPAIIQAFTDNLEVLEEAGRAVGVPESDLWSGRELEVRTAPDIRRLEKVQPTIIYSKALNADSELQRELYSVFEFARADIQCLTKRDVLAFMGSKLEKLVKFDAAVFYGADLTEGVIRADYILGSNSEALSNLTLNLEQKLSGWAAANNQSLCNLPPFPDFIKCTEPRPNFELCAIAPINKGGTVLGAISLYRKSFTKFTDEEFRRLEIVASQSAVAMMKCVHDNLDTPLLFDNLTGVPNGFQLYLMFDQLAMDAHRYDYPITLLIVNLDDLKEVRKRWGHMSGDEALRAVSSYLRRELRETDLLVRYASDEFIAVNPKMNRDQAEALKSRLQNDLDHFQFAARPDSIISMPVSIGISVYPEDGTELEGLMSAGQWRMREDRKLRTAIRPRLAHISPHR